VQPGMSLGPLSIRHAVPTPSAQAMVAAMQWHGSTNERAAQKHQHCFFLQGSTHSWPAPLFASLIRGRQTSH
jgi:hypothetical protein